MIASGLGALAAESICLEPRRLQRVHLDLTLETPRYFPALSILYVSDFHYVPKDRWLCRVLQHLISETRAIPPDLLLIAGDFVEWDEDTEEIASMIGQLTSRFGTFAVLGNHDYGNRQDPHEAQRWSFLENAVDLAVSPLMLWRGRPSKPRGNNVHSLCRILEEHGIQVLRNEARNLTMDGSTVWIVGVDEPHQRRADLRRALADVPENVPYLLLAHSPEVLEQPIPPTPPILTVCGHTHGGQVVFPGMKPLITHTRVALASYQGLIDTPLGPLYISRGLGGSVPIRFRCPPEITTLTLRSRVANDLQSDHRMCHQCEAREQLAEKLDCPGDTLNASSGR